MSPFDETQHPRANDGRFAVKDVAEAAGGMSTLSAPKGRFTVRDVTNEPRGQWACGDHEIPLTFDLSGVDPQRATTRFEYMWRDSDNNKNFGTFTVRGAISVEQARELVESLDGHYAAGFDTEKVGVDHLAHLGGYEVRDDDPPTHELTGLVVSDYTVSDERSLDEVLAAFRA